MELRKLHDQLELTIQSTGACTWEADIPAKSLSFDPGWMKMRGYPPKPVNLTMRELVEACHPEDRGPMLRKFRDVFQNRASEFDMEHRLSTADGGWRWVRCRGVSAEVAEDGKLLRMIGVNFDITQQKQHEAKITALNDQLQERVAQRTAELAVANRSVLKTEERFRAIFENSPIMIALLDVPDGRMIEVNSAVTADFGYTREELIGHTTLDLGIWVNSADRTHFLAELHEHSGVKGFETNMRRKNGEAFPVLMFSTLLTIDGKLYSMNCLQDIETQRESEARFRNLIAQSPLGFYRTSAAGRIILANPALIQMLDYRSLEELQERNLSKPGWFVDRPREEFIKRVSTHHEVKGLESSWLRADGTKVRIREHARCVRNAEGELQYFEGTVEDITARYEAKTALRKSEERWKLAVEGLGDGAWDWDIVTGAVHYSKLWKEMLGYDEDDVAPNYQSWEDRVHPEDLPRAMSVVQNALEGDPDPFRFEARMKTKNGDWRWILSRGIAVDRDAEGKPRRMVGSHSDITQRKAIETEIRELNTRLEGRVQERTQELELEIAIRREAEQKVAASEAQYRRVVENAQEVILEIGLDRKIEFLNPAWQTVLGFSIEESLGRDFLEFTHPDDRTERHERFDSAMKGAAVSSPILIRLITNDGDTRWMESHVQIRRSNDGDITGTMGTLLDRTEQYQAEQELRDSERRYHMAVTATNDGVWDWDLETGHVYYSPRWEEMLGFQPGTAVPSLESFDRTVHPEDREATMAEVHRYLHQKIPTYSREFRMIRLDGAVIWTLHQAQASFDDYGKPIRLIGTTTDITARRHTEMELRRRTRELEAVNQELEAFSYSVSHDLRAPLRGIDGWSLALAEDYAERLDAPGQQIIDHMRHEAQRMDELIDGLLQLARTNRNAMNRQEVYLNGIIRRVTQHLQRASPERIVNLEVEPDLMVSGDAMLIESLVLNLLSNAWKFTKTVEWPNIEIGRQSTDRGDAIFVRDNGVGFDMAYADKLFTPFQRMHKPSEFPGAGIGLATVQRIVRRHGGEAWAHSEPNNGATFYFTLPTF